MPWLQLKVTTNRDSASTVEEALLSQGALSVTFEDDADEPIYEPELGETPLWKETRVTGLFDANVDTSSIAQSTITQSGVQDIACAWEILEDKDWQREWLSHFKPLKCSASFWVCPSHCEPPDKAAINLILDPGLAFGTGTHPTTFMCLEWVANEAIGNKTVIDYGCGSGILGIAALLHGAHSVCGVDIDPQALTATRENVTRNNLDSRLFSVYLPETNIGNAADIVFANILAGPLVDLAPKLISLTKPGGKICLSGILSIQREQVISAYQSHFAIDAVREKDEWVCITGTRTDQ